MHIPDMTLNFSRKICLAGLAGLFLVLIFPKFDIEFLAWIAFIPLLLAIQDETPKNSFWLGWTTGFVSGLGSLYWVTITMVSFGGLPSGLSAFFLVFLTAYLALYTGSFTFLLRALQQSLELPFLVTAPVLWAGLEYLRSFFLIGFPWNSLGYSQYLTPQVTQFADITGVYGVSFLIVLVNAGLYTTLAANVPQRLKISSLLVTLGCFGLCLGYGLYVLPDENSGTSGSTMRLAVVQGNIDQSIKWSPKFRQEIFEKYIVLSKETLPTEPDMIVWPETAVPFILHYDPSYKRAICELARELDRYLLFGGIDLVPNTSSPERPYDSLNSAFLASPGGEILGKYDKMHLVPFGEYVPFENLLFFVDRITQAIGSVQAGTQYTLLVADDTPFGTLICFEIIFPNLVRKFVDKGARFLVTITNDAWFGRSAASYQHFAMVTFRAIENRVAIARAANTGISGFIDPYGRILSQSKIFVDKTITQDIPLRTTTTFYSRYGDLFARLCMLLSVVGIAAYVYRRKKSA